LNNWVFPLDSFDFIHVRELFGCVSDWDDFFAQAYAHTKPGGYVEICEHSVEPTADDGTLNDESFMTIWGKTIVEMGEKYGKGFSIWRESKACLERAGFVDVVEKRFKWPLNEWPSPEVMPRDNYGGKTWKQLRQLGRWNQLRLHEGVEGYTLRILTTTGGVGTTGSFVLNYANEESHSGLTKKPKTSCIAYKSHCLTQMSMPS
jgi:hypothetical protein